MQTENIETQEFNKNKSEDSESIYSEPVEEGTLTRAESDQILCGKRDRMNHCMMTASVVFAVVSVVMMIAFKRHEGFFDASGRIGILMESVNAQEMRASAPKLNVRTTFRDENGRKLILPLKEPVASGDINIREEFTQNKYVITLTGYSKYMPNSVELVSDSSIMDAVGVYRQQEDVVIEVYCVDRYDYELAADDTALTVNFHEIGEQYAASAVIWLPYEDRNRLALPEWRQRLEKAASDHQVRLYLAPDMQEAYTQADVIQFANEMHADMVLGVQIDKTQEPQAFMTSLCNSAYFIPDYNSAALSVVMAEVFSEITAVQMKGFEEAGSGDVLVSKATVPSALIKISLTQKDMESVESEYQLNEKVVSALENTIDEVVNRYIKMEEIENES